MNCQQLQERLADMARDYWEQAEEAEDNNPCLLPPEERIADFLLYYSLSEPYATYIKK